MPVKFDLMKTGAAPLRKTSPAYVDPEDFSHEERAAPLQRMDDDAAAATKVATHFFAYFDGSPTGKFVVHAGRVASVFGIVFGLVVLLFWVAEPRMFHIDAGDWFFWVVWMVHAAALCLAFLSRMTARCWRIADGNESAIEIGTTPYKLFTRDPFSNRCEGCIVGTLNFAQAAVVIVSLFVIMQAMLSEGNYQHELKLAWTIAYICQSVAVWLQILCDCMTLYLVHSKRVAPVRSAFLLSSLAGVLACFCIPIFTVGYSLYCAACCAGVWSGLIF